MSSFEFHSKEPACEHVGIVINGSRYYWTPVSKEVITVPELAANMKISYPDAHVWYSAGKTKVYMTLPS